MGRKEDKAWLYTFAETLGALDINLKYNVCLRANHWNINDENDNKLLLKLRETGMETATVGIEAGNQADLDLYNKKTTVQQNENILKMLSNNFIHCDMQFININPYSTIDRLHENLVFLHKVGYAYLLFPFLIVFQCYKGTRLYELLKKDGMIVEEAYKTRDKYFERFGDYLYEFKDPKIKVYAECFTEFYEKYFSQINALQVRSINYEVNIYRIRKYNKSTPLIIQISI